MWLLLDANTRIGCIVDHICCLHTLCLRVCMQSSLVGTGVPAVPVAFLSYYKS